MIPTIRHRIASHCTNSSGLLQTTAAPTSVWTRLVPTNKQHHHYHRGHSHHAHYSHLSRPIVDPCTPLPSLMLQCLSFFLPLIYLFSPSRFSAVVCVWCVCWFLLLGGRTKELTNGLNEGRSLVFLKISNGTRNPALALALGWFAA